MLLYLIADVPRHFQTAVWGLSSKGFRRHIKANSVSSKLVVKSAYNPLKTPVNQGLSEIIIEFTTKSFTSYSPPESPSLLESEEPMYLLMLSQKPKSD